MNGRKLKFILAITEVNHELLHNPSRNKVEVIDEVCRRFNFGPSDSEFMYSVFANANPKPRHGKAQT
ncbi:MAG: hypothetical protein A2934_00700 [Candidatus Sungbacteria bacterium RIFCSPLOWO2_01_FULL_47_10]|uniref:Uncharacterized protein n=1 Tax=Candidatus Sungbacteria bacterium RIFCSPLOWO2_01_FULL_47_10 TaxID=1802276 RepID=A0A1G2L488_9BACT|nr:MAG: hypothetical protein A2934_00700 [Candidatus Sungbacteria bacterium RIFCSPLOWO2_01_FULL_47_10]